MDALSPRLLRVTLAGPELQGLTVEQPAASVRLLLPEPGTAELATPTWNGNEFLLADGRRPTIRTFTPRRMDPAALELDVDIVFHGSGAASQWAHAAEPGWPAAVSGPGRGYAVDVAVDGVDGWNAVRAGDYHLVISDVDMPRMDGIALVRSIKQDPRLRSTPVVIVSYKDREEDRMRGLDAGADGYLTKSSFHDQTFLDAVADLIGEARG